MNSNLSTKATLGIAILFIAWGCAKQNNQQPQGPKPVSVAIQTVHATSSQYYDEYPATVRAQNEVELRAQISGYITGIHFQEGQSVKKGQKLYTIDPQQSESAYQQAQANLAVQEANLNKAKGDVERYRALSEKDAIAKQQVDYAEAAYIAAVKQVDAAKAAVRNVQTNVRYTSITAPFDGTIGISQVRLGAAVSPGTTVLNTISTDNPMVVDILVDQKDIFKFSSLSSQKIASADSVFLLSFGGQHYEGVGSLSVIDRAVDAQTGTIRVRFTFANPKHILRAGMSGTLLVKTQVKEAIVIPFKAVTEQLGEYFVYKVNGNNNVTQQRIFIQKQLGNSLILKDGLTDGDVIVTEGVQNLREGSTIQVAEPTQSKN
jgi:membrane fusion protein (multidrug efflux system)